MPRKKSSTAAAELLRERDDEISQLKSRLLIQQRRADDAERESLNLRLENERLRMDDDTARLRERLQQAGILISQLRGYIERVKEDDHVRDGKREYVEDSKVEYGRSEPRRKHTEFPLPSLSPTMFDKN